MRIGGHLLPNNLAVAPMAGVTDRPFRMIVQRPDIAGGVPFPVVLPLAALRYGDGTLFGTYIPKVNGGVNHGSTLYVFGRVLLK